MKIYTFMRFFKYNFKMSQNSINIIRNKVNTSKEQDAMPYIN